MTKSIQILVILFLLSYKNDPITELYTHTDDIIVGSVFFFETDFLMSAVLHLIPLENDRLIVIDGPSWRIYLTDLEGKELAKTGGAGRGPGEFLVINDAFIGNDGFLYVYDAQQMRMSAFDFSGDTFNLVIEHTLSTYDGSYRVNKIVPNGDSYFGVYKNPRTEDYLLLELDDEFNPIEKLLDFGIDNFPEVPTISIFDGVSFAFLQDNFVYINNYTLDYYVCELVDFSCTMFEMGVGERKVTDANLSNLEARFARISPDFITEVKSNGNLPWANQILAKGNSIIINVPDFQENNLEYTRLIKLSVQDNKLSAIQINYSYNLMLLNSTPTRLYLAGYDRTVDRNDEFMIIDF